MRNTGIFGYREGIVKALEIAAANGVNGKLKAALLAELEKANRACNRLYGDLVNSWAGADARP